MDVKREQLVQDALSAVIDVLEYDGKNDTWEKGKDWVSYSGPHFDPTEIANAVGTLLDGWYIFGKQARKFEQEFPKQLGQAYGVFVNSGSSANLLAFAALRSPNGFALPEGAGVITPVVCFPTTLNPIIQNGLKPVFVDVTMPDLNLNLDEVEKLLIADEGKTIRAITFAHVLGNPPDMDRLMYLVRKYDLIFVEDACDALGSTYRGTPLGSFGHISTCSFFPAHHMTTLEGGMVTTRTKRIWQVITSLRDWGRDCYCNTARPGSVVDGTACKNRFQKWLPGMPEVVYDHRYVFGEIGYNLKPLELQGAVGLAQLEKLPSMEAARRENFKRMNEIMDPWKQYFHMPEAAVVSDPCWFAYLLTVRADAPFTRDELVSHLESRKIQTRAYFSGLILAHPGYQELYHEYCEEHDICDLVAHFPVAAEVTTSSFFLGTYIGLTAEKLDYIEEVIDEFFNNRRL